MKNDEMTRKDDEANKPARPAAARKRASGNWNPDWEPFAKLDPAWTEKVVAMAIAPRVAGVLDAKTIELIGIALDAFLFDTLEPLFRLAERCSITEAAK